MHRSNAAHRPSRRSLLLYGAFGLAGSAGAQSTWPNKPVKIVVTFPPGGGSDVLARVMGEYLPRRLGQTVIVDNRPGAGGTIGGSAVMQSAPDGYTLMLSNTTPIALGPFTLEKQPYDPLTAFTHVSPLGVAPLVIMANPKAPFRTVADMEAHARRSGQLEFGSGGPGSIGHILGELFKLAAKVNLVHIPYRGGAPMTTDLISGIIPAGMDVLTAYLPFFKTGQLVPLAVTSAARSPLLPDVPSVTEFGYRRLVLENFFGISAPARLPADIAARINSACNEVLALPEVRAKLADLAITPTPGSTASFNAFVNNQVATLAPVVKGAGIRL